MEKVTAAVLMTRREATAEASLARMRDLRKLGTAIAAIIRITATTRSSSIRENPLCLRIRSPHKHDSVGGATWDKRSGKHRISRWYGIVPSGTSLVHTTMGKSSSSYGVLQEYPRTGIAVHRVSIQAVTLWDEFLVRRERRLRLVTGIAALSLRRRSYCCDRGAILWFCGARRASRFSSDRRRRCRFAFRRLCRSCRSGS